MEPETREEIDQIDQLMANDLALLEQYPLGSEERKAALAEIKFFHECRKDEANTSIELERIDMEREKNDLERSRQDIDKAKNEGDAAQKKLDTFVNGGKAVMFVVGMLMLVATEGYVETVGSNRSKISQKAGPLLTKLFSL